jgi:hypothetical protein
MTERTCENCRWWENDQHAIGVCFRHVPMGNLGAPKTHATDRCGEWADASITPEQEERQELTRRFAVAIMSAEYAAEPCLQWDRIWAAAQNMAAAEPQIQREGQQ